MNARVLVVSSANMDFVMNVERVPEAGETVTTSGTYKYIPGGKGANAALAFARLGADCAFCARVGNDANGEQLAKLYRESGIDTEYLGIDCDVPTGLAAITVDSNGQNRITVFPGANDRIPDSEITRAFDFLPEALFMQLEIPYPSVLTAAGTAAERGVPIFLDAGPASTSTDLSALPALEVISPNETETEIFTGIKPTDEESCLRAAIALSGRVKAKYYVIKLGSRGVFVYDGEHSFTVPSYSVRAVDTTAAGDVFTSALTLEYLRNGKDIHAACKYANAAGAISVTRHGASSSIPTDAEVREFMRTRAEV